MDEQFGEALCGFDAALTRFRAQLAPHADLLDKVFGEADGWMSLLTYKLVPHLGGAGCLVASIAGGTNTGKSTVFNLLAGGDISPVRSTAAATCRPVLACNARRFEECCEGKLVPEFHAHPLEDPGDIVRRDSGPDDLYVVCVEELPDQLVLLDTPDVDSIDRRNWTIAEHIRAAGDVIIAVITAEKYQDERVISFFKQAHATGRVVLPLMNKANPADDFATARAQIHGFCEAVGIEDGIAFVIPHDFSLEEDFSEDVIQCLGGDYTLIDFLESLEVLEVKEDVYGATVSRFVNDAGRTLRRARRVADELREVVAEFESRAAQTALAYDPQPDARVGEMLHGFIKARRGIFGRNFGKLGDAAAWGLAPIRRAAVSAWRKRATLSSEPMLSEEDLQHQCAHDLTLAARQLALGILESAPNLKEPAARLVAEAMAGLDLDAAVQASVRDTLRAESVTASFREHAERMMQTWWDEHKLMRQLLRELDAILIIAPTAVAVPLSFYTAGVGVSEATAVAGIVGGNFFSQILVHQFSENWVDLLRPWREEQRARLREALNTHIVAAATAKLREALAPFDSEDFDTMGRCLEACRKAL